MKTPAGQLLIEEHIKFSILITKPKKILIRGTKIIPKAATPR